MPKISVIVPVYKVESYLHRCVDSILVQTFTDFELILVDDGSPDNCGAICDEYAAKDARVRVIHQENGGLSAARNVGIDWALTNSDSQWISFVDSDDWVHQEYLLALYNAIVQYGVEISACDLLRTESEVHPVDNREIKIELFNSEYVYTDGERSIAAYACGRLYRKELFCEIRFPEGKIYEDIFTIHKVMLSIRHVALVKAPLYYYYVNPNSITNSVVTRKKLDYLEAYDKLIPYLKQNGFSTAYRIAVRRYLSMLSRYYSIALVQWKDADLGKRIKHRAREIFYKEVRKCSLTPQNSPECYNLLFPRLMWLYWGTLARIERIMKNNG